VRDLLAIARQRYGADFDAVLTRCAVWVNGDEPVAGEDTPLTGDDEVAILPPVSGGGSDQCAASTSSTMR